MTAVVIRAWDSRHNPIGHAVTEFITRELVDEEGIFAVPEDHPLVQIVKRDLWAVSFFTVLTTEQLQWRLISVDLELDSKPQMWRFTSRPWINELRRTLVSDQWFVENVIEPAGESSVQP